MNRQHKERLLIVDDEKSICDLLATLLTADGYACTVANDGETAARLLETDDYDVVISDILMPGMSGMDLLMVSRTLHPDVAFILATGVGDKQLAMEALELGAYGYILKPFKKNDVLINVANAAERRRVNLLREEYEERLREEVARKTEEARDREREIVLRLLSSMGYRDDETGTHARRIGLYSAELAQAMGWEADMQENIKLAAPMHDIGKIGIPDNILLKPGSLDKGEFEIMQRHTEIGAAILAGSKVPVIEMAREIALCHHERWDGSGYPQGLSGETIPISARIVAIVDVYDALTHDRVYRPALPEEEALSIMTQAQIGRQYDPAVFKLFKDLLPRMRLIRESVPDHPDEGDLKNMEGELAYG